MVYSQFGNEIFSTETRACLVSIFRVTVHGILRQSELHHQRPHESYECYLLRWRAGIFRLAILIQATYIADAYRPAIVSFTMCSDHGQLATRLNISIDRHHIVITDAFPSLCPMPGIYLFCMHHPTLRCSRAMQNYSIYLSHN